MSSERFRFPGQPSFQFQPAVFPGMHPMAAHHHPHPHHAMQHPLTPQTAFQARGLPPTPQPAHTHPPSQTHVHNVLQVPVLHPLSISQEELDMVLYGYAKGGSADGQYHGHALSGLNLSQMSAAASAAVAAAAAVSAAASSSSSSASSHSQAGQQSGEQPESVTFGESLLVL